MKPESAEIITPRPFFKIRFGCSNRAFYNVKSEIYEIGESIGIEPQDGYMSEKCDYEGDLEKILIYREERSKEFITEILKFYEIDPATVPDGMDIELAIF